MTERWTRAHLLARTSEVVRRVRESQNPSCEMSAVIEALEAELEKEEALLAHDIDELMARKYRAHNIPPPVEDAHGCSGQWGGWAKRRERAAMLK